MSMLPYQMHGEVNRNGMHMYVVSVVIYACGMHMRVVSAVICAYGMHMCGGMYEHISHGCAVYNVYLQYVCTVSVCGMQRIVYSI